MMTRCSMRSTVEATGVTATRTGSRSICVGEIGDLARHGGGEQQRLALLRQLRDDRADVVDEAHVEHAVGFVEHQHLDLVEAHAVLPHEVEQAAGRRDQHVEAVHQVAHLAAHRHAADDERGLDAHVAAIGAEAFEDLAGQFARRAEHQHARALLLQRLPVGGEPVEDRQRERGGLAGAGLRDADEVASGRGRSGWRRPGSGWGWCTALRARARVIGSARPKSLKEFKI